MNPKKSRIAEAGRGGRSWKREEYTGRSPIEFCRTAVCGTLTAVHQEVLIYLVLTSLKANNYQVCRYVRPYEIPGTSNVDLVLSFCRATPGIFVSGKNSTAATGAPGPCSVARQLLWDGWATADTLGGRPRNLTCSAMDAHGCPWTTPWDAMGWASHGRPREMAREPMDIHGICHGLPPKC